LQQKGTNTVEYVINHKYNDNVFNKSETYIL